MTNLIRSYRKNPTDFWLGIFALFFLIALYTVVSYTGWRFFHG